MELSDEARGPDERQVQNINRHENAIVNFCGVMRGVMSQSEAIENIQSNESSQIPFHTTILRSKSKKVDGEASSKLKQHYSETILSLRNERVPYDSLLYNRDEIPEKLFDIAPGVSKLYILLTS